MFPHYTYSVRAHTLVVGNGAATGVVLVPKGGNTVSLAWGFPNMGVQLILTLAIVFTGILPGLILFGLVWAVVSSDVDRMK